MYKTGTRQDAKDVSDALSGVIIEQEKKTEEAKEEVK